MRGLRRPGALFAIAVVGSLLLAGCNRSAEVHYRVTVKVDDRGITRSGSSVWAFRLTKSGLPLASPYNPSFRGEAVVVELPGRGTLFALVKSVGMYPENLFGDLRRPQAGPPRFSDRVQDLRHIKGMVGASATLDCINPPWIGVRCPTLVRFRDISDPKTIEVVDPADLAASFGPNIRLKSVTVQITDDPVTTGIEKLLPSFGPETGFDTWYRNLPFGDPRQVSKNDFTTGVSK